MTQSMSYIAQRLKGVHTTPFVIGLTLRNWKEVLCPDRSLPGQLWLPALSSTDGFISFKTVKRYTLPRPLEACIDDECACEQHNPLRKQTVDVTVMVPGLL